MDSIHDKEFRVYPHPFWIILAIIAVVGFGYLGYEIHDLPHH